MLNWTRPTLLSGALALVAAGCVINVPASGNTGNTGNRGNTGGSASTGGTHNPTHHDATFTLMNDSAYTIVQVYVSPTDESDWGPDMLGSEVLYPGGHTTIDLTPGYWDFQLIDEDGDVYEELGVHFPPGADETWEFDV